MTPLSDGGHGEARCTVHDRLGPGSGLAHPFLRSLDSGLPVVGRWTEAGRVCSPGGGRFEPTDEDEPGDPGAPAVLELDRGTGSSVLTAVGEPIRLSRVLARLAGDLVLAPDAVTITRGAGEHAAATLAAWGLEKRSEWDRMATVRIPETSTGVTVDRLDLDRDRDAVAGLLAVASPATQHGADDPGHTWYGVRAGDRSLSAVGAYVVRTGPDGSLAHLGGIATLPELRGRGLGTAVTARLTAEGIAEHGMVTLGMYADNTVARRVYERLGFRVIHEVETWRSPDRTA